MPRQAQLVVVGSSNTDMVVKAARIPAPGQTILGGEFLLNPGGKGANQAVAAARLGAAVTFVARLGRDVFGDQALAGFQREGLDTRYVVRDSERPSGVALIMVDERGQNAIAVAPGANEALSPADVEAAAAAIAAAAALVVQLEVPFPTVRRAVEIAKQAGTRVILDPAPVPPGLLPRDFYPCLSVLKPNQIEAAMLLGLDPAAAVPPEELATRLLALGVPDVVVTLGANGALALGAAGRHQVPGFQVQAVDSTAAGDCFTGALAVALAEGLAPAAALRFAAAAASLSVTRRGAQASLPVRAEVDAFLKAHA